LKADHRERLYAAGKIVKVFGIKGEVKLFSYARTAAEFQMLETVTVGSTEETTTERIIDAARDRGGDVYVKFRGIDDRNAAEEIVNHFIYVDEGRRKAPQAGRYYIHDLIGCSVRSADARELGTLKDVMNAPGGTLYVVATHQGDVLLPAVKEFITEVNIAAKIITVSPPEGLFEGEAL
jgi:16S rRNA processing protein RimM